MPTLRPLLVGLTTLIFAHAAAGADPPRPAAAEIAPLVGEALRAHPEVLSIREGIAAARARISPAGALPDPTATLTYQNGGYGPSLGSDEDSFLGVSFEQPLPLSGKRRLAVAIATKSAEELEPILARFALNVEAEIRRAYTDLLLARESIGLIAEQERTWDGIEGATRARYSAGLGEQQDVLRAQAERTRLIPMRVHEEGNEEGALAELNRLLGRPAGTDLATPRRLAELATPRDGPPIPPREELLRLAEERSPEIAAAGLALERARLSGDLARRMLRPDLVASTSYMNRGALPPMWSVGLGFMLPLHASSRQRHQIVEAESAAREEAATREALRLALRVSIEKDLAEWKAAVKEAGPYASGVLIQDRLAVDAARASYESGKVPFVSMLEALSTFFSDVRAYNDRLAHVLWHEAAVYRFMPAERIAPRASMSR